MQFSAKWGAKVRDYECDIQGIVNNSVYQNYLEHARHEMLMEMAINFADLAYKGINLVVIRAEIDYRSPLKSGDSFWVGSNLKQVSKLKFAFSQQIFRVQDEKLVVNAQIYGAALNSVGKPMVLTELNEAIATLHNQE